MPWPAAGAETAVLILGTDMTAIPPQAGVTPNRYGSVAIAFHWLTAVLVLAAFVMGPGGSEHRVYSAARDFDRQVHEVLGLAVFGLTLIRLAWQVFAAPVQHPDMPLWMIRASKAMRVLLYLLLVVTPVTAVLGAWLEGHPLTLGLLGNVPPMIPEAHAVGLLIADIHTILGDAIMWLAGLHAAAALFHHFMLRDEVLHSMLPEKWLRRNAQ